MLLCLNYNMANIQMPSSGDTDPNSWVSCPYDPVHRFPRKRTQYHLIRCRKNHPTAEMVTCTFNAIHVMPKPELRWHLTHCPDKGVIQQDIKYIDEKVKGGEGELLKGCTALPEPAYEISSDEEDWDADEKVYNNFEEIPGGVSAITNGGGVSGTPAAVLRRPRHLPQVLQQQKSLSSESDFSPPTMGRGSIFKLLENQTNHDDSLQLQQPPATLGRGRSFRPPPPGFGPLPHAATAGHPPPHGIDNLPQPAEQSFMPLPEGVTEQVSYEMEEPTEIWD